MADPNEALPARLKREPLLEAVWEMRFVPAHEAASAVLLAVLLKRFGKPATKPERLPASEIPATLRERDENLRYAATLRFKSESFVFLVGDSVIAVSSVRPYAGWASFKSTILHVVEAVSATDILAEVNRMSLKYVDVVGTGAVPSLSQLNVAISIGGHGLSSEPLQLRTEIQRDSCIHVLQVGLPAVARVQNKEELTGVMIDVDSVIKPKQGTVPEFLSSIESILDTTHSSNKRIFFSLLTPETLRAMEPEYPS